MDVVEIERAFTAWLAEKLNLTVDAGIYRGGIPENVEYGVAVIFGSEIKASSFYGFRPRTWNVQILAKFDDRDAAMILQTCLNGLAPATGFTYGGVKFLAIVPRGSGEPYTAADDGKTKHFVSANWTVSVLTTGRQTE